MGQTRTVAFLSDFGHRDPFVGICHAVIAGVDPEIRVIDLTHGIDRQDIRAGAVALADAVPFLPSDSVVVAVVDPGVGSDRRALAVVSRDGLVFVGPDNGLMWPAIELAGGADAVFEISRSEWRLEPVSDTFHGRDIFSPVAARIAAGDDPSDAGTVVEADSLVALELPRAEMVDGELTTAVLSIDEFGNARLAATADDLPDDIAVGENVEIDTDQLRRLALFAQAYADAENGDPILIVDSTGSLSVSINGGDAATDLRLEPGKVVRILPG
jgi:hypothetical protein